MTRKQTLRLSIGFIAAAMLMPQLAAAQCGAISASSSTVSCEQCVRVIRATQNPRPSVSPAQQAQIKLQRERIAVQRQALAQKVALEKRRLKLEATRVRNEAYLYRSGDSPLRARTRPLGYGTRGVATNSIILAPGR